MSATEPGVRPRRPDEDAVVEALDALGEAVLVALRERVRVAERDLAERVGRSESYRLHGGRSRGALAEQAALRRALRLRLDEAQAALGAAAAVIARRRALATEGQLEVAQ